MKKISIKNKIKTSKILKRLAIIVGYVVVLNVAQVSTVFGADEPLTVINNFSNLMFSIIRAVGMILAGWGVVQIGTSLKSHDATQRASGIWCLVGGILIMLAKEVLNIITGG